MPDTLIIKIGLSYSITSFINQPGNVSSLTKTDDSITLSYNFSGVDCNVNDAENIVSHHITFNFQQQYLDSFSSNEFQLNVFPQVNENQICCNSQMILHEIVNTKLKGAFLNMFLESKALDLLLCFQKANAVQKEFDCTACKFLTKPIEQEKIFKAREIILSRLNNAPTIQELSLEIGMNQCYLKKGFKEIYGVTVYDFVQEQRMLKAKLLLTTTQYSLSQVAEEIGFSGTGNFSTAFKKHTGVFPSELQQN
jgi:AraC-like DNA-binding protein